MCHAPRRTASLLTFCLALLFCCTVLTLAPPSAARADRAEDALVLLPAGTGGRAVSRPRSHTDGQTAPQRTLIAAVQAAVDGTEGVAMGAEGPAVYPAPLTVTAADFSAYRRTGAGDLTDGAAITYSTLIPLVVTGLKPGAASAGDNYRVLEGALSLVNSFTVGQAARYREVLFKVTLPPGVYYLSYYDGAAGTAQCLHLCRNTWLSMNGVTLRKADTVNGAMLRNCLSGSGSSGYGASGNLILEGGTWDVGMAHFDAGSDTDRFSSLRLGHGENILLTGVTFLGSVNGHHLELCGINGCSVVNCTFQGYLDTAYRGSWDLKEAIQIDVVNNDAIAPAFGRYDDTISGNVVIYGNTFRNLCRGPQRRLRPVLLQHRGSEQPLLPPHRRGFLRPELPGHPYLRQHHGTGGGRGGALRPDSVGGRQLLPPPQRQAPRSGRGPVQERPGHRLGQPHPGQPLLPAPGALGGAGLRLRLLR